MRTTPSHFTSRVDREAVRRAEAKNGAAKIDHIYMDAMGFGMGCSCLQLTFQACNVNEARKLYDALVPLAPLLVSFRFTLRKSRMLTSN